MDSINYAVVFIEKNPHICGRMHFKPMFFTWKWKLLSCVQLFATPWTIQSMEFSSPEYWNALPFPSPGDLPNPGMEPRSPTLQADSLPAEPPGKPQEYWSGQPRPPPGELPDLGGNPGSPLQADSLPASYQGSPMVFSRANFKSVNTSLASKNTFVTQRQHLTWGGFTLKALMIKWRITEGWPPPIASYFIFIGGTSLYSKSGPPSWWIHVERVSNWKSGEEGPREVSQIPGLLLFGGLGALRHLKGWINLGARRTKIWSRACQDWGPSPHSTSGSSPQE